VSAVTYVRWRSDEPREQRVFPALPEAHPAASTPCPACAQPLGDGTPVQLLALGPADDAEDREKHAAGRWYSAVALVVHATCLGTPEVSP
jgi:hypothetical protein